MSALPPKADIPRRHVGVRFGPQAEDADLYRTPSYSGWGGFTVKWYREGLTFVTGPLGSS